MNIKNQYGRKVLVYFYAPNDTVYTTALAEVIISDGETKGFREDKFSTVKVSVRKGVTIFDPQLIKPGEEFDMKGNYILTAEGHLVRAELSSTKTNVENRNVKRYEFFDSRNFDSTTKRTISSSFRSAYSQSTGIKKEFKDSTAVNIGAEVGAWIGPRTGPKGGSAKLSVGFTKKVEQNLIDNNEKSLSRIWEKSTKDEFTFEAGKLYAIEVIWRVAIQDGVMHYFGESTEYSVIQSADGSLTRPAAFASEAEMPAHTKEEYQNYSEKETA